MNHHYADITSRLGTPLWWDEFAVPRYCEFQPYEGANIYAREVVLLLVSCQSCGHEFKVCMSSDGLAETKLARLIETGEIHYGDPPNANCCMAGPTMNSVPRRVLKFWERDFNPSLEWVRRPHLEREIDCEWAA